MHPPEPPEPNPYKTFNNRLMKYETYLVTPAQQEMGVLGDGLETLGGGFFPPGELRVLQSTTYYYYNDSGNVERVVTNPNSTDDYSAIRLGYAKNARAVSFAAGETWQWDGNPGHITQNYEALWLREFRYDGPRERCLNRQLDPGRLDPVPGGEVWTDYDGDDAYGDFAFSGGSFTELTSYEPGLGKVVGPLGSPAATNYHTNMIGTTRFMSDAAGSELDPAVYTAFRERIDGTNHRYGYAGASGYQAHDEMPFLHVGARYYDPATGRFLQRDPIGIRGGQNVYTYADNDPNTWVDPSGLRIFGPTGEPHLPDVDGHGITPPRSRPRRPARSPSRWGTVKKVGKRVFDVGKELPGYVLPNSPIPADAAPGAASCMMYDARRRHILRDHPETAGPDKNCAVCQRLTPKSQRNNWR